MAAALVRDDVEGAGDELLADGVAGHAVVGVDDELEGPAARALGQLGVADRVVVARLPRHQAGEALAAALDQVEPLVLAQRAVAVGCGGHVEQLGHGVDVALAHLPLHLEAECTTGEGTA